MPGTYGKCIQERSARLCWALKAGETESGGSAATTGGVLAVLLSVVAVPALC